MPKKFNYYNYRITEYNKLGEKEKETFFLNHYEIMEKLGVSHQTIFRTLKTGIRIKKLSNLQIEKVKIPVYSRILNDVNYYKKIENEIT